MYLMQGPSAQLWHLQLRDPLPRHGHCSYPTTWHIGLPRPLERFLMAFTFHETRMKEKAHEGSERFSLTNCLKASTFNEFRF